VIAADEAGNIGKHVDIGAGRDHQPKIARLEVGGGAQSRYKRA